MRPILHPGGHVRGEAEVLNLEVGCAGVAHHHEGRVAGSQVRGPEAKDVDVAASVVDTGDAGRKAGFLSSLQGAAHDGGDGRRIVDELGGRGRDASGHKALVRTAMVGEVVAHRAHQREAVGDLGLPGEEFANIDARHVGPDGPEIAAEFRRRIRLHVVGVELRGAARQPHKDDGLVLRVRNAQRRAGRCQRAQPQKITQAQAQGADAS